MVDINTDLINFIIAAMFMGLYICGMLIIADTFYILPNTEYKEKEKEKKKKRGIIMTREQAINYLKSSGMSDEQIKAVVDAFNCEDAISRQAVLDIIEDDKQDGCYSCFEDAEEFEQKVREIPSVTPKTKIGKWIVHPKGMYAHLVCNKCISRAPYDCRTNYCPNCGAKMAESEE